ncbi:hypothetical protein I2I05_17360 [Hymenobacter sp. BT683]|uniref:Uncharacterized protein n=1 Tax=Hymenobacter jeongseonensis TaxID=2791027 RepID=A0ABS0ILC1_9BACT|nr:DUF6624 domain-containing protein [Hymenobacter jeongseonensis]MBF9239176.1 hypothetical protein [Hymenobacter jeongseonensis]
MDSLAYVDQWPMQQIFGGQKVDSLGNSLIDMEKTNFARHQPVLEKIVKLYGYPGFKQVGEKNSNNFWLLVQHADAHLDFQRQVLTLMLAEVKRKNASPINYAYLTDRIAIHTGKPEEYGTQVKYEGPGLGKAVPVSLRGPKNVNKRRAAIGMETLEGYLKMMTDTHIQMNSPQSN